MTRIGINAKPIPGLQSPAGLGGQQGLPALDDLTDVDLTGLADGDTIVFDDATDTWVPGSGSTSAGEMVPYFIASGDTFTVPVFKQALYAMEIDNEGTLEVNGFLLEVD